MNSLEELFCHIDDFCQQFEPKWHSLLLGKGVQHRQRQRSLSLSVIDQTSSNRWDISDT